MSVSTDEWVNYLDSLIGIREDPDGSNRTPIGEEFGWNGVAWCCETQSLALFHTFGEKILWTASVAVARASAQAGDNGLIWVEKDAEIRVGDLACFDWGFKNNPQDFHISGVVNPGTQDKFMTIGGNENNAVVEQWRDRYAIMGFIRPPFESIGLGNPQPAQGDGEMASEDIEWIKVKLQENENRGEEIKQALAKEIERINTDLDWMRVKLQENENRGEEIKAKLAELT